MRSTLTAALASKGSTKRTFFSSISRDGSATRTSDLTNQHVVPSLPIRKGTCMILSITAMHDLVHHSQELFVALHLEGRALRPVSIVPVWEARTKCVGCQHVLRHAGSIPPSRSGPTVPGSSPTLPAKLSSRSRLATRTARQHRRTPDRGDLAQDPAEFPRSKLAQRDSQLAGRPLKRTNSNTRLTTQVCEYTFVPEGTNHGKNSAALK